MRALRHATGCVLSCARWTRKLQYLSADAQTPSVNGLPLGALSMRVRVACVQCHRWCNNEVQDCLTGVCRAFATSENAVVACCQIPLYMLM